MESRRKELTNHKGIEVLQIFDSLFVKVGDITIKSEYISFDDLYDYLNNSDDVMSAIKATVNENYNSILKDIFDSSVNVLSNEQLLEKYSSLFERRNGKIYRKGISYVLKHIWYKYVEKITKGEDFSDLDSFLYFINRSRCYNIEGLLKYISRNQFEIDKNGNIVAYRRVNKLLPVYVDLNSGRIIKLNPDKYYSNNELANFYPKHILGYKSCVGLIKDQYNNRKKKKKKLRGTTLYIDPYTDKIKVVEANKDTFVPDELDLYEAYQYIKENENRFFTFVHNVKKDESGLESNIIVMNKPFEIDESIVDYSGSVCSSGLHAATYEYAKNHYSFGDTLLKIIVNPKDIASFPTTNEGKFRCVRYTPVEVVKI